MLNVPITVVIPTRERCDVLGSALQTVTAQDYEPLEIIVSDNFSADRTRDVVAANPDPRIRYLNTGRRLSMSHNWEFALSHVRGGWVSVMGDDDGLLPGALTRLAALIAATGVRAIRSDTCYYAWPSLPGAGYGRFRVPLRSGYVVREARTWLSEALSGRASYTEGPMLYSGGFADFAVLQQLRAATGAFYRSCIPDVYSAVALASVLDKYAYSYEPFAVNGASRHSTGTSQMSVQRAAAGSAAQRFAAEGNIPFHADVPLAPDGTYPPSVQVFIYESFLQTQILRADGGPSVDRAEELAVILGSGGRNADAIHEWGKLFARQHALDFGACVERAAAWRAKNSLHRLIRRLTASFNVYKTDSQQPLPHDVLEATVAATTILATRGRLRNLSRALRTGRRKRRS
jgi:hypothetical protein